MSWVSLEEAVPIPDISWSIRVLQPPPEQENVQYGELGPGLGCLLQVPQHIASVVNHPACLLPHVVGFLGIASKRFSLPLVDSHGK